jgi:hypothetical protein
MAHSPTHVPQEVEAPEDYVEPKKIRWVRWLFLGVVVLVLALFVGHWWWSNRAGQALVAQMAEYARRGEPARTEDFQEQNIADGQNIAIDLRAAAKAITTTDDEQKKLLGLFDHRLPLSTRESEAMAKLVGSNNAVSEHIKQTRGKTGIQWGYHLQSPLISTLLPDLNDQKLLADFLACAALHAHHRGDHEAAIGHVEDLLLVARATQRQPFLVGNLMSVTVRAMACQVLREMAPDLALAGASGASTPRPADRERVRAIITSLLDDTALRETFHRALLMERLGQADFSMAMGKGNPDLTRQMTGANAGPEQALLASVARVLKPMAFEDGLMMVRHTTAIANATRAANLPAARAAIPPFPLKVKRSLFHLAANLLMPAFDRAVERHYAAIAEGRMTAVTLAIRLYAIDHDGNRPKTLQDLVPNYLPEVPADPFARNDTLKYLAAKEPLVYSVGTNAVDDGGNSLDRMGRPTPDSPMSGLDYVLYLDRRPRVPTLADDETAKP